jgi:hypothetical protein
MSIPSLQTSMVPPETVALQLAQEHLSRRLSLVS